MPPTVRNNAGLRARTREAILSGARALIARGEAPTVANAAAEAGVSKATAYRYFSDPAVMVAEAGIDLAVADYETITAGAQTLADRLKRITVYFFNLACDHESEFRTFLARSVEAVARDGGRAPRRGARRMVMLRRALDEDGTVPRERREDLVRALSMITGTEAMIVAADIARLDRDETCRLIERMTDAMLEGLGGRAP